jgi:hypothetical protein
MTTPENANPSTAPRKAALYALVTVRWADSVLATKHLGDGGEATVGAAVSTLLPLPCESLGVPAVVVATVHDGVPVAFVPRGAVAFRERPHRIPSPVAGPSEIVLAAGETVSFPIGGFIITITAEEAAKAPWAALSPFRSSFGPAPHIALAALAHALLIGLSAQAAFASSLENEDANHDDMRRYLAAAEERSSVSETVTTDAGLASLGNDVNEHDGNGKDGGGTRAKSAEGAMGARDSRTRGQGRFAISGAQRGEATSVSNREEALLDARSFGLAGVLASESSRAPFASFGEAAARGRDPLDARGSMWSTSIGETFGAGGLGLNGVGDGGGGSGIGIGLGVLGTIGHTFGNPGDGTGGGGGPSFGLIGIGWGGSWGRWDGIGLGRIGTLGHGAGHGTPEVYDLNPRAKARPEKPEEDVEPRLPPAVIRRIVRQSSGLFRACYQSALLSHPKLAGGITTRFLIGADGHVKSSVSSGSDLPDKTVVACVTRAFYSVVFPEPPEGRPVTVTYPLTFSPDN